MLHPGTEQDIADAATFYESEASPLLASRFVREVERVLKLLLATPNIGGARARGRGRRGFPLTGFPYTVVYRPLPTSIIVLIVKHDRRRPRFGSSRR